MNYVHMAIASVALLGFVLSLCLGVSYVECGAGLKPATACVLAAIAIFVGTYSANKIED